MIVKKKENGNNTPMDKLYLDPSKSGPVINPNKDIDHKDKDNDMSLRHDNSIFDSRPTFDVDTDSDDDHKNTVIFANRDSMSIGDG